jgi:hypothetical protein
MAGFFDWIKRRSDVEQKQANGTGLAAQTVEKFKDRTFKFKGPGMKHSHILSKEIIRFIHEELPQYYDYRTQVTTFYDKDDTNQANIKTEGTVGIRGPSARYNPLDRAFIIKTERPG